jgi:hypothetical protein
MSEQQAGTATGAPADPVSATPAASPAPAPATPDPRVPQPSDENQPWFQARLKEARARLLEDLGITDEAKAKAQLAAAQKAEDEKKSIADKLTETSSKLTTAAAETQRLLAITTEFAARQMVALTAEQQTAVKAIAGDDPAAQLKAITALQPTWAAQASAAPAAPAQPAPPASGTAPPPNAPASTQVSQPNHREVHAALLKKNPFAAAEYAEAHLADVFPDSPPQ